MSDLVVLVPSRGRPCNIARLEQAFRDTGAWDDPRCHLVVCVDDDDPALSEYVERIESILVVRPRLGLVGTLNEQALWYVNQSLIQPGYVGFMGDDHCPRTFGWAERIRTELRHLRTGLCYGNDLFQGETLPTAVFMTADIVETLGYMAPPCLKHMWADNSWKAWGDGIDRIRYLPDVIIEHLHPHAGKAEGDEGYGEVWPLMGPDEEAFGQYRASGQLTADIEKLKGLL